MYIRNFKVVEYSLLSSLKSDQDGWIDEVLILLSIRNVKNMVLPKVEIQIMVTDLDFNG